MAAHASSSIARIGRGPFYPLLVAFAASCFLGTFATDIVYWRTADMIWVDFSDWLVTAGVIVGCLAVVVALIEVISLRPGGLRRPALPYAIGMIAALILAIFDMLVHTRDAWTSVVPWGLVLLAAVVVVVLVTGWMAGRAYDFVAKEVRP